MIPYSPLQTGGLSVLGGSGIVALILPLLFVVPGLVGLETAIWTARRQRPFGRLETLVLSLLLSSISLLLLYSTVSVYLWQLISFDTISRLPLHLFIIGYISHLSSAVLIGVISGSLAYNYLLETLERDQYETWDFAFEDISDDAVVDIATESGDCYRGLVVQSGLASGNRDLLISSPRDIESPGAELESEQDRNDAQGETEPPSPQSDAQSSEQSREAESGNNWIEDLDEQLETDVGVKKAREIAATTADFLYVDEEHVNSLFFHDDNMATPSRLASDSDRIQARLVKIANEIGVDQLSRYLYSIYGRLTSRESINKWLIAAFTMLFLISSQLLTIDILPVDSTILVSLLTSTLVFSIAKCFQESKMTFAVGAGLFVILGGGIIIGRVELIALLVLIPIVMAGYLLSAIGWYMKREYTTQIAWYLVIGAVGVLLLPMEFVHSGTISKEVGWVAAGTVLIVFVLTLIERIRHGDATRYEDWPKAVVDVSTAFVTVIIAMSWVLFGLLLPQPPIRAIGAAGLSIPLSALVYYRMRESKVAEVS